MISFLLIDANGDYARYSTKENSSRYVAEASRDCATVYQLHVENGEATVVPPLPLGKDWTCTPVKIEEV